VLSTDEDMASAPLSPDRIAEDADMEAVSILAIAGMPVEDGASMPMEGGTLFVDAGGNLVFDPGPDFQSLGEGQSAEFPVPVTVGNAAGDTLDVPVTVRVSGINDAPTPPPGNGDGPGAEVDVPEDQPGTLPPDLIGSDPEMGPLSVVAVEGTPVSPGSELVLEGGGVLSVAADGTLVFDPGTDFDFLGDGETNSFELGVTLADDFGARTDTVVTITVVGANDAPRVISAERVTDQDTPAPGLAPSEIAFDPEMDEVFLVSAGGEPLAPGAEISLAGGGVLRVAEDGTLVFDPLGDFRDLAEGETREAAIPLSLADGQGATGEDVLTIRVSGLNDAPVPLMPMISTTEDMVSPGLAARAAAADPDASDALGVVSVNGTALSPGGSVALPGGGALLLAEDGTLLFDPQDGFQSLPANGAATLTVTLGVSDAGGRVVPVPLEIEVAGLNDAPVARDDPGTLADPLRPLTLGVLANDSDIDGDALSVVSVNGRTLSEEGVPGPGGGVFRVAPDGGLIFDPGSDFLSLELGSVAAFDIEYAVADGFGGMASALAGVRVVGDASSGTATNLPARLAGPKTIAESVVTPDPEVRFGTFDALGFLEPDLTEEEPVTNRGDDENWRR
jgi:VCBS repeat-containing protein